MGFKKNTTKETLSQKKKPTKKQAHLMLKRQPGCSTTHH